MKQKELEKDLISPSIVLGQILYCIIEKKREGSQVFFWLLHNKVIVLRPKFSVNSLFICIYVTLLKKKYDNY